MSAKPPNPDENGFLWFSAFEAKSCISSVSFWSPKCFYRFAQPYPLALVVRTEMRKLFTILALLGLAVGISAQGARADSVTDPATIFFNPSSMGGLFSLTFPATGTFPGNNFDAEFMGSQMFNSTPGEVCAGPAGTFCTGSLSITAGTGFPTPSGSFFFNLATMAGGDITGGSGSGVTSSSGVTYTFNFTTDAPLGLVSGSGPFTLSFTVPSSAPLSMGFIDLSSVDVTLSSPTSAPEPSSLLLLGSGFLALGFARKRLIARFN
jgi:hypothetical protein